MSETSFFDRVKNVFNSGRSADILASRRRNAVFNSIETAVVFFDTLGMLLDYNAEAEKIFELSRDYVNVLDEGIFLAGRLGLESEIRPGESYQVVIPDGMEKKYYRVDVKSMSGGSIERLGNVYVFHDVTEIIRENKDLEIFALRDRLTGLYNGNVFEDKILDLDEKVNYPLVLSILNIDGLQDVNEEVGLREGNRMIRFVAEVVRTQLKTEDMAFRIPEGIVILSKHSGEDHALRVMKRITEMCRLQDEFKMPLSFQYGIAVKSDDNTDVRNLLPMAVVTMNQKKAVTAGSRKHLAASSMNSHTLKLGEFYQNYPERVRRLSVKLCEKIGLNDAATARTALLAEIRDIGMITVPVEVLTRFGPLNDEEWKLVKGHSEAGFSLAKGNPVMATVAEMVLYHHEHYDGSGYPYGLKDREIPLPVRIVSIAECYDVMVNDTSYSKSRTHEEAIQEILDKSGTQFDPVLARHFADMMKDRECIK